mmetsp:Transcript_57546/g.105148  ORF Transcript_57546/g.105148 Transcript_57546/m.105148 type:complete len:90 (-) Transcript_57546:278-547(-)
MFRWFKGVSSQCAIAPISAVERSQCAITELPAAIIGVDRVEVGVKTSVSKVSKDALKNAAVSGKIVGSKSAVVARKRAVSFFRSDIGRA